MMKSSSLEVDGSLLGFSVLFGEGKGKAGRKESAAEDDEEEMSWREDASIVENHLQN